VEALIQDSIDNYHTPEFSKLKRLVPSIGSFFTPLPLVQAFDIVDKKRSISGRVCIPPSFNDIRHILNTAQILAISGGLKLVTFDGDMTLYQDGHNFAKDSPLAQLLISLLHKDITVAIVTAAGYQAQADKYEQRLEGLLSHFKSQKSKDLKAKYSKFYVLGGECHYMFRYDPKLERLVYIEEKVYQPEFVKKWQDPIRMSQVLDVAQAHMETRIETMGIKDRVMIIRKERAVGVVQKELGTLCREQLEELALDVQQQINKFQKSKKRKVNQDALEQIPFCAFNGGNDVWVDIGNKLIGVQVLLTWLGMKPAETLHVGDQVT
jgi:IMP and pyridine-specific 5'-nucleotidase